MLFLENLLGPLSLNLSFFLLIVSVILIGYARLILHTTRHILLGREFAGIEQVEELCQMSKARREGIDNVGISLYYPTYYCQRIIIFVENY